MSEEPLVSVVIPTYDRERMLTEAVESALAQTYGRFELLVADDGSTDGTPAQMAGFRDPRIRLLRQIHSGRPSVVRNSALRRARGELIAFLDDDDLWLPDKLEKQVTLLNRVPQADFVYTDIRRLAADGSISDPVLQPWDKWEGKIFDRLLLNSFLFVSTIIVRRAVFATTGLFDETLAAIEDFDLWLRVTFVAQGAFLDDPVVLIRRHPGGISAQRQLLVHENVVRVLERVGERLPLTVAQRLRLRRAVARAHTRLGLFYVNSGRSALSRRHFFRALRLNPLQRTAWKSLAWSSRGEPPR
jgi:glycosyltransferase involved in cell wall biosynthesis